MPFDFEQEFGGDDDNAEEPATAETEAATAAAAEAAVDEYTSDTESDDEVDTEYLGDVDKRLEVATHYRELVKAPLFSGGGNSARIVEREIRKFVRERLEVLLSIREPAQKTEAQFNDEEVALIRSLLSGHQELSFLVNKVREKDAPARVTAPAAPVKAAAPAVVRPTQAPAPAVRPAVKPAATPKPAAAPKQEAKPTKLAPKPAKAKPAQKPAPKAPPAPPEDEYIEVEDRRPGQEGKTVRIKRQRRQAPQGAVPMPMGHAISQATEAAASRSLSILATAAPALAGLAQAAAKASSVAGDIDRQ
jgi:hypothetical protein